MHACMHACMPLLFCFARCISSLALFLSPALSRSHTDSHTCQLYVRTYALLPSQSIFRSVSNAEYSLRVAAGRLGLAVNRQGSEGVRGRRKPPGLLHAAVPHPCSLITHVKTDRVGYPGHLLPKTMLNTRRPPNPSTVYLHFVDTADAPGNHDSPGRFRTGYGTKTNQQMGRGTFGLQVFLIRLVIFYSRQSELFSATFSPFIFVLSGICFRNPFLPKRKCRNGFTPLFGISIKGDHGDELHIKCTASRESSNQSRL